eukprot:2480631-Amphidinium_carterae.1
MAHVSAGSQRNPVDTSMAALQVHCSITYNAHARKPFHESLAEIVMQARHQAALEQHSDLVGEV